MTNIETFSCWVFYILNIFCLTRRRRFSQYLFVFFFFTSERKNKISSFAFLKNYVFHLLCFSSHVNIIRHDPFLSISEKIYDLFGSEKIYFLEWCVLKLKTFSKEVHCFCYIIDPSFHFHIYSIKLNAT